MRSLVLGDGGRANITPLTELLVDYVQVQIGAGSGGAGTGAGVAPTSIATNARLETLLKTPATLANSVNRVIAAIQSAGNVGDVGIPADFLGAPLVARVNATTDPVAPTVPGNAQDLVLETLRARGVIGATGLVSPTVVNAVLADAASNKLN
jgi:hypothetical protein